MASFYNFDKEVKREYHGDAQLKLLPACIRYALYGDIYFLW